MDFPTEIDHRPGLAAAAPIILFDGVCNFCSRSARFILARDHGRFRFAALQSAKGADLLQQVGLPEDRTVVLIEGDGYHTKSSAALGIARSLSGPWPLLSILLLVPKPLRDYFYDAFAARRYRWFGRRESCFIPADDIRGRFFE